MAQASEYLGAGPVGATFPSESQAEFSVGASLLALSSRVSEVVSRDCSLNLNLLDFHNSVTTRQK